MHCVGLQELAGDNRPNEELVCPEATAGLWSTITFSWVSDLMKKGYKCAPAACWGQRMLHWHCRTRLCLAE